MAGLRYSRIEHRVADGNTNKPIFGKYLSPSKEEKMLKTPVLVMALLALTGLAPLSHAATLTASFSQTVTFDNITVTVSGSFTLDTTAQTLEGTATVTAVNNTSGATIYSRTFTINLAFGMSNSIKFVLSIPAVPLMLAASCNVSISTTPAASCTISKSPDVNHDGVINIIDLAALGKNFGTSSSITDLNSDGIVNILDLIVVAIDFGAPVFG